VCYWPLTTVGQRRCTEIEKGAVWAERARPCWQVGCCQYQQLRFWSIVYFACYCSTNSSCLKMLVVRRDRGIKVQTELGIYHFSIRHVDFDTHTHNIHALQARITVHREHCKKWETIFVRYVYWTVHHLDSWVKRDQLDVTCFVISLFNAQHVSDVNTSILRSLRLMCWVISWVVLLWFDVCWCYVVVWLGWCGIRMQVEALVVLQPAYGDHTTTANTPNHIEPEEYNPRNNSTHKSQAPEDECINIRNMLSII